MNSNLYVHMYLYIYMVRWYTGKMFNAMLTRSAEIADVMMANGAVVNTPVSITRPART